MLHVISCQIVLYLYNIYTESNLKFFTTYFMCILCKSRVMYQSIYVFVHDHHVFYCILLHKYHMEQFFMFQQLSYGIICNTCIICIHVYHFDNISHYVLQLSKVYSENITYISKYISMYNCLITSYVNV